METLTVGTVILAALLLTLVGFIIHAMRRARRLRAAAPRNDQLRAGSTGSVTPQEANSRATGKQSWMRPGGGPI